MIVTSKNAAKIVKAPVSAGAVLPADVFWDIRRHIVLGGLQMGIRRLATRRRSASFRCC